ncbi:FtsX-like permease family protein [Pseudoduganella sp. GCM10020061]|uniref:FtsX-like permease family protein n=1 Tax=Pseudoduganella sp. GCM10020061 TaxID=3317345 RepID=UPI00363D5CDF
MKALDRKLLRDLWHMRTQALAIALVLACGVGTFIMFLSTLQALRVTQQAYYQENRFADLFATLKRAPESLAVRIRDIDGVASVQTRVAAQVRLTVPGFGEPVMGLMVSAPEPGAAGLNALYLAAGRLPDANRPDEVVVSKPFAQAHQLGMGSQLTALLNGRQQRLRIVGTALSPEFIEQMRPGAATPDYLRFGVMWMGRRALGEAYDMHGAFNDVAIGLAPQADSAAVITRLDRLLAPYGGLGAYTRSDQHSHRFLTQELDQLGTLATLFPAIFLGVAAFLLHVVIGRLVATQRGQVASLKAFGYHDRAIAWHYFKLVGIIAAAGIAIGIALGTWLGAGLAGVYQDFYHFPYLHFTLPPGLALAAAAISMASAAAGAALAVRRSASLPPAQAMRPEAPARYSVSWIERLGARRLLSQPARMILRHIQRGRWHSLLTVLGISLAGGIILTSLYQRDTVTYMLDVHFRRAQRDDLALLFNEPSASRARHELAALPGVRAVEVYRVVPVRLRFGASSYRTALRGTENGTDLQRLLDSELRAVRLPQRGLLLTDYLATMLGVRPGERLVVELLEGRRAVREVVVAGVVKEYFGVAAYMELQALNALMLEGPLISGAYLAVDRTALPGLYTRLARMPRVASIAQREQEIRNFNRMMEQTMLYFSSIATAFAVTIAFGVIYNSARIALAERSHELASLRVLGFTRAEIAYILLGELGLLTLAALPVGLLLGRAMCYYIAHTMQNDLYRVPVVLEARTYAFSIAVVLVSAILSGLALRRRMDRLDLLAVLKKAE